MGMYRARPAEERRSAAYAWLVVLFLMLLYTCSYIDRTILSLLVAPIRADLGISDTQYSLLAGLAFALLYALAGIPLGRIVDRWSRRNLIAGGVAFWSLMTMLCGGASSFAGLFAARVGVGIGEATLTPGSYSLVADYFPPRNLSRALSIFALGVPIGTGLASLIGGPLVHAFTISGTEATLPLIGTLKAWQAVFIAVGLPGLGLAALTLIVVREPQRRQNATMGDTDSSTFADTLGFLWTHRTVYAPIFLGMALIALFSFGAAAWYPTLLQRNYGFDMRNAGLLLGASTLILGIAGAMTAGWLADHWLAAGRLDGHFRIGILYGGGMLLTGALGPIIPLAWLSLTLIAASAFFSVTWIGVNAAALQLVTPNRMRGQMTAIYQFVGTLISFGLGPTAVALTTDHVFGRENAVGLSLASVGCVSLALGCLILQLGRRPLRRRLAALNTLPAEGI